MSTCAGRPQGPIELGPRERGLRIVDRVSPKQQLGNAIPASQEKAGSIALCVSSHTKRYVLTM